jgi:hypothetical protein
VEKIKKFFSIKLVEQIVTVLAVVLVYTAFVFAFVPSAVEWLNCVTDVVVGTILCQIVLGIYETVKKGKPWLTWQYYVTAVVSVLAVAFFFYASRAVNIQSMFVGLAGCAVTIALYLIIKKFMYVPSTMSMEELIDANWDRMKAKAKKMGYERFLEWEKGFRCYPTDSGTVEGELLFDRPYHVIEKDGKTIPLTYNGAVAHGYTDVAEAILSDLVRELKASNI